MPLAMDDVMWNHEKDNKALEESLKNLIEMASKDTLPPNQGKIYQKKLKINKILVKYTLELVNQNIDFLTGENNILLDNIAGIVEKNSYIITAIMV